MVDIHVNDKARFLPLAGVKGYSFITFKRVMKGRGDVGTTTYRRDKFPQVSVKESPPFHTMQYLWDFFTRLCSVG